jgi:hypothetical protein
LIQIKLRGTGFPILLPLVYRGRNMPADSLLVSVAVVLMFSVFGAVLLWGDRRTSRPQ